MSLSTPEPGTPAKPSFGRLLKAPKIAEKLGCSLSHVYGLFNGSLPYIRIGSDRRVSERALEEYVARLEAEANAKLA